MAKTVYAVDDDEPIRELLESNLRAEGFDVHGFDSHVGLFEALAHTLPDAILLDIMLPEVDGLEICRRLRADPRTQHLPILMLTARDEEIDIIVGLEVGADDYVTKPFSARQLSSRLKAIFRRIDRLSAAPAEPDRGVAMQDVHIDPATRQVTRGGVTIALTLKEYELLYMLLCAKGKVLTRDLLLDTVWGDAYDGGTRTVDVHIMQLRKRLGGPSERYIETIRGVGYRFKETETGD